MKTMTTFMLIAMVFPALIVAATLLLSKRAPKTTEKASPFECGFDPINSARIPFSLQFFILAVLFLVFDIEIALLMPLPPMTYMISTTKLTATIFMLVLILGLYHEWNEGSLEWK